MWETLLYQQLVMLTGGLTLQPSLNLDPLTPYLPHILGLGIISISHSILTLLGSKKHLALLITPLSVLLAYLAEVRLEANYFLVLFCSAVTLSAIAGAYARAEDGDSA